MEKPVFRKVSKQVETEHQIYLKEMSFVEKHETKLIELLVSMNPNFYVSVEHTKIAHIDSALRSGWHYIEELHNSLTLWKRYNDAYNDFKKSVGEI